jgi:hypothetical protein
LAPGATLVSKQFCANSGFSNQIKDISSLKEACGFSMVFSTRLGRLNLINSSLIDVIDLKKLPKQHFLEIQKKNENLL